MIKILIVILLCIKIFAYTFSSNDDYKIHEEKNYNIIFTKNTINEANFIKNNIEKFLHYNQKQFGFTMDQKIQIVLVSNNIQQANAFSTQTPFNSNIYYNGGSGLINYSNSWLKTIFIHETTHNYQINAKKSNISKTLYKYLGNNIMPVTPVFPIFFFTLPNVFLPTAIIEGNAVLNESIIFNGGRLRNGELNALKNSLVFNNKINGNRLINNHLNFPYTTEKYIIGGYYMQFMANKYGLKKVNNFFYEHSIHAMNPFLLNNTYIKHFYTTFEESVNEFIKYTKKKYAFYNELKNNQIATSKSEIYLSKIDNKIYFITTNLKTEKNINIYNIKSKQNISKSTKLKNGNIFNINEKLYSLGSDFINKNLFKYGLFDENNYLLKNTQGHFIYDIKDDQKLYLDINTSYLESKLYLNDEFYDNISSNAIFDKNQNIYYFKQKNKIKTLYKNKKAIFSFEGSFAKLIDVFNEEIYFISNTKNGSGIYKINNGVLHKISQYDNIINGKIIDKNNALVVTVNENGYNVSKIKLKINVTNDAKISKIIHNDKKYLFNDDTNIIELKTKNYSEISQLQFSSIYPYYSYDSNTGISYHIQLLLADPILFNSVNLYHTKDNNDTYTGIQYINDRYIPIKLNAYHLYKKSYDNYEKKVSFKGNIELYDTFLKKGRNTIRWNLKHYLDEDYTDKKPVILKIGYNYKLKYPLATSNNIFFDINAIAREDRKTYTHAIKLETTNHIMNETYLHANYSFASSDEFNNSKNIGVKMTNSRQSEQLDYTNVFFESNKDKYVKKVQKISLGLSKTFYFNHYFSRFPISLRKESLFYKYSQYNYSIIDNKNNNTIHEHILGINIDLLVGHLLVLPITFKYITSDSLKDNYKTKVSLGFTF